MKTFTERRLLAAMDVLRKLDPSADYDIKYNEEMGLGYVYRHNPKEIFEKNIVITQIRMHELYTAIEALIYGIKRGKEIQKNVK